MPKSAINRPIHVIGETAERLVGVSDISSAVAMLKREAPGSKTNEAVPAPPLSEPVQL
jgi:hypothetical protein